MIVKPSRLALGAFALVCAAVFLACNCAPTLRYITISPGSGTVYVSGGGVGGVKGARRTARPMVRNSRRASVRPQDITTAVCGSLQFSATGYYSNGTTSDQSTAVTWSSSSTSVATVDNTGLATGIGLGFTNINATLANISAQTTSQLEVDQLNSITIAPADQDIALGGSQAFTATGAFTLAAGGTASQDITSQVTWASSNPDVATIDNTGNATSVGQGSTTISATSCDTFTTTSTTLTVGPPVTVSLQITPAAGTAAVGTTVQYTAVRLLSDGTTQPTTNPVTWSSDTTSVATINASTGLAQAISAGTANITATEAVTGYTGTVPLTVQAAAARFAYVANISGGSSNSGSITSFTVNPSSTSTPLTFLADTPAASPQQVLLHPSGDLLYYIDSNGALHSDFVNSATGAITGTTQSPSPATTVPSNSNTTFLGAIDPTGRFIYVVTTATQTIFGFSISHTPGTPATDGALAAIPGMSGGFTDTNLNGPSWVLTDNAGKYLYVVNSTGNTISQYSIDQTTGALTALGAPTVATGNSPLIARTDANGHLFVANEGDESVSAYNITASGGNAGELVQIGSATTITGATDTLSLIASPNGNYLYVLDYGNGTTAGQVFAYGLTSSTGAIGSVIGTPQPTGIAPFGGMAIDPTGVLLAVDNFNDSDISTYTIGSNGGLTPTSTPTVPSANGQAGANTEYIVFYTAASGQ